VYRELVTPAAEREIHAQLFDQLRRFAVSAYVEKRERDHATDYSVDVYMISPDELARLIQEEALRLRRNFD
jgi:hypothetical protein